RRRTVVFVCFGLSVRAGGERILRKGEKAGRHPGTELANRCLSIGPSGDARSTSPPAAPVSATPPDADRGRTLSGPHLAPPRPRPDAACMAESPVPSPARQRDRRATEAAIVAAGERLLLRDGFPGLNVQTLAAEAGCDRKLVYRYFEGVDGVVARLGARAAAELVRALDAAPAPTGESLRAFARASLAAWLAALRASPLTLRLMAWALVERSPALER